jgi:hypothetical protein
MMSEEETRLLQYVAEKQRIERGRVHLADRIYQDAAVILFLATTPQRFIFKPDDQEAMYREIHSRLRDDMMFSSLVRMLTGSIMNDLHNSDFVEVRKDKGDE